MKTVNAENLYSGAILKNYGAMCKAVGEEIKGGNGKICQIKRWKKYIDFDMDGQKFIINKIRTQPLPDNIRKDDIYTQDVFVILSDYLSNETKGITKNEMTISQMLVLFGFVSDKYLNEDEQITIFSEKNNCSKKQAIYFYSFLNSFIRDYCVKYLKRNLDRLATKNYITVESYYKIIFGEEKIIRKANHKEEKLINSIEKAIKKEFKKLNYYNRRLYYSKLNKELLKYGIKQCYKTYYIDLKQNKENLNINKDFKTAKSDINKNCLLAMYKQIDDDMSIYIINDLKRDDILVSEEIAEHFNLVSIKGINQENKFQYYEYIKDLKKSLVDYFIKI